MSASPVSCCSVYLEGLVATISGVRPFGFATGFLYAGPDASRWLVTNWHVVAGRRPDFPGILLGGKPESPTSLRFAISNPRGGEAQDMEVALYDEDGPTWIEGDREAGTDLALLRLRDPPRFPLPLTQGFAPNGSARLEPGLDVVIVGHPFEFGLHAAAAVWKGAMVASDLEEVQAGRPWILLDAPGAPGMSGSPVYRKIPSDGASGDQGPRLELVAVYAGTVGDENLHAVRLGRAFPIALV